jgi:hypothetical protein
MPAKTTQQPDDLSNPYGYSAMDWAAQLDPAYAAARAEGLCRKLPKTGKFGLASH